LYWDKDGPQGDGSIDFIRFRWDNQENRPFDFSRFLFSTNFKKALDYIGDIIYNYIMN